MLTLIDGPCKGFFMVKRAPVYLRAVIDESGNTDVLDQIDDTPQMLEKVHVYKREGSGGVAHLHGPKISGWYALGTYRYMPEVNGESLRDNSAWQTWAINQNKE